ncbi:unnamed protein product [Caenorhabditis brenneri]
MSRPLMPNDTNVSKREAQPGKVLLTGYAYLESYSPSGVRVFVPGYREDFFIPNSPTAGYTMSAMLDEWIEFSVFEETKKFDPEVLPIPVCAPTPSARGTIILMCQKVGDGVLKTVGEGHVVTDPDNELGCRGIHGNFMLEIRLRLKPGCPNKPVFVVDRTQPVYIPARVVPREAVNAQTLQPYVRRSNYQNAINSESARSSNPTHGRSQIQNPPNESELPRHLRPSTNRHSRPVPVFHNVDSNGNHNQPQIQHAPPPPLQIARPGGYNAEFPNRRSFASVNYYDLPRNFAESTFIHPPSNSISSTRTSSAQMQRSQAGIDKEIADIVKAEMRNPRFRRMLEANFPDVASRLLALM